MFTSLKLSKLLADNGFEGESKHWWVGDWKTGGNPEILYLTFNPRSEVVNILCPAYDILNDLCVKYAKEIFGVNCQGTKHEEIAYGGGREVLRLLQQNKQDEAEEYIWENCLFNPNNK